MIGRDLAGLEVARGELHQHGVDALEAAGGEALILDAVLRTDDRDAAARRGAEVIEGGNGVLRLHGQ